MIILVSLLALSLLNFVDFVSCQDPAPAPAPGTPAPAPAPGAPGTPGTPAPGAPAQPGPIPTTIGTITSKFIICLTFILYPNINNPNFKQHIRGT